jgi:hypothetical protein
MFNVLEITCEGKFSSQLGCSIHQITYLPFIPSHEEGAERWKQGIKYHTEFNARKVDTVFKTLNLVSRTQDEKPALQFTSSMTIWKRCSETQLPNLHSGKIVSSAKGMG